MENKRKQSGRQNFEPTKNRSFFVKEEVRRAARPQLNAATWKPSYITQANVDRRIVR